MCYGVLYFPFRLLVEVVVLGGFVLFSGAYLHGDVCGEPVYFVLFLHSTTHGFVFELMEIFSNSPLLEPDYLGISSPCLVLVYDYWYPGNFSLWL